VREFEIHGVGGSGVEKCLTRGTWRVVKCRGHLRWGPLSKISIS
jgi:hypothetical protein